MGSDVTELPTPSELLGFAQAALADGDLFGAEECLFLAEEGADEHAEALPPDEAARFRADLHKGWIERTRIGAGMAEDFAGYHEARGERRHALKMRAQARAARAAAAQEWRELMRLDVRARRLRVQPRGRPERSRPHARPRAAHASPRKANAPPGGSSDDDPGGENPPPAPAEALDLALRLAPYSAETGARLTLRRFGLSTEPPSIARAQAALCAFRASA